jgi:hypothetical protein
MLFSRVSHTDEVDARGSGTESLTSLREQLIKIGAKFSPVQSTMHSVQLGRCRPASLA